jgi:hypothetical protein
MNLRNGNLPLISQFAIGAVDYISALGKSISSR